MNLGAALLWGGVVLLAYALALAPYKDEKLFREGYWALSDGQSAEYSKLRNQMLTPKFSLQDYGGTLVATGAVFLVSRKGWNRIRSPKSRTALFGLAFAAPLLIVGGCVFDLLQGFDRGEFPHWADSMGIPILGLPIQFVLLLVWSLAHLTFLRGSYEPAAPLVIALSLKSNWWLLLMSAVTASVVLVWACSGQYWYALPGLCWLYFYLSLAAGRRAHAAEPGGQPDAAR